MAGWLTRAAAAFVPKREAAPQPFAIPCDCGAQLAGFRVGSHQKLRCLGCDRPILVLPADPYPAVKRRAPPAALKPAKTVVHPEDRSTSPTHDDRKSRKKHRSRPKHEEQPSDKTAEKAEPAAPPEPEDRIDVSPVLAQAKARRRTLRLVAIAIAALVAVTGWSLRNRAIRERARLQIPTATEAGLAALRNGDFANAVRELTVAVQGLETLRRTDVAAETIRQAHREAVAAQGLSQSNLSELAREFLSDTGAAEERERRFQQNSGAQWLVFDVGMIPTAADNAGFEMEIPWSVDDRTLQVVCDFPALRQLAAEPSPSGPPRFILAGQIESWFVPEDSARPVVARLKTSSAFLWSDYDSYLAIGYQPDSPEDGQETRELLNRQRETMSRQ